MIATVLRVAAYALLAHLAWDDFKELKVWDVEVVALFVVAWVYWALVGASVDVLGLAVVVVLLGLGLHLLGKSQATELFPIADVVGFVGVALLAPTATVAAMYLSTLAFIDMLYRLVKCGLASTCNTPLFTLLFASVVIVDVARWAL